MSAALIKFFFKVEARCGAVELGILKFSADSDNDIFPNTEEVIERCVDIRTAEDFVADKRSGKLLNAADISCRRRDRAPCLFGAEPVDVVAEHQTAARIERIVVKRKSAPLDPDDEILDDRDVHAQSEASDDIEVVEVALSGTCTADKFKRDPVGVPFFESDILTRDPALLPEELDLVEFARLLDDLKVVALVELEELFGLDRSLGVEVCRRGDLADIRRFVLMFDALFTFFDDEIVLFRIGIDALVGFLEEFIILGRFLALQKLVLFCAGRFRALQELVLLGRFGLFFGLL